MADLLFDTDILIELSHGAPEAIRFVDEARRLQRPAISSITEMELPAGCRNQGERRKITQLLKSWSVVKLTEPVNDIAVRLISRYSLSHGLAIPDELIAATAIQEHAVLATRNRRDVQLISGLKPADYPLAK